MEISREHLVEAVVNNTNYRLDPVELEQAYNTYIETHDRFEVTHQLKDLGYEDWENIPEDIISDLASQVRERMNALMDGVVLDVIHQNEDVLEQYREVWKIFVKKVRVEAEKEYLIKARNEEQAENLWASWEIRHNHTIVDDIHDEIKYNAEWEYDDVEEDEYADPDIADITEEDC